MATYIQIATYTAPSTVATIDFSSIPSTYTDLLVKISARGSSAGINAALQGILNNSTAANYNWRQLQGNGGSATSASSSSTALLRFGYIPDTASTASTFSSNEIYIPNYAGSTAKSLSMDSVQENNSATAGEALMQIIAGSWTLTSPINQITFSLSSGSFLANSTATLYGISKS